MKAVSDRYKYGWSLHLLHVYRPYPTKPLRPARAGQRSNHFERFQVLRVLQVVGLTLHPSLVFLHDLEVSNTPHLLPVLLAPVSPLLVSYALFQTAE
jgi:hypothetical protein